MTETTEFVEAVPIARIFLHLSNPRFEEVQSEAEAIERLCRDENVLPLARDIVAIGMNPLERFALVPTKPKGSAKTRKSYIAAEGNRRLCALKLLNDPDLAPAHLRARFEALSESWSPILTLQAVIFKSYDDAKVWIQRTHSGEQGGVGRKNWKSEQKQRFSGESKNASAQALLDYAESKKMISKSDRTGKITTVTRFITKQAFQEHLGLEASGSSLHRTRPTKDFDFLLERFLRDLVEGEKVTSRMNKADIARYARTLSANRQISGERTDPEEVSPEPSSKSKSKKSRNKPKPPKNPKFVSHEVKIYDALQELELFKLESLYHSITSLELDIHAPMISVGMWSFIETLTATMGRSTDASFVSYMSKRKLTELGFGSDTKPITSALTRIQDFGNNTKHHAKSAAFDGNQLHNDFDTLTDCVLKCIEEISKIKG